MWLIPSSRSLQIRVHRILSSIFLITNLEARLSVFDGGHRMTRQRNDSPLTIHPSFLPSFVVLFFPWAICCHSLLRPIYFHISSNSPSTSTSTSIRICRRQGGTTLCQETTLSIAHTRAHATRLATEPHQGCVRKEVIPLCTRRCLTLPLDHLHAHPAIRILLQRKQHTIFNNRQITLALQAHLPP